MHPTNLQKWGWVKMGIVTNDRVVNMSFTLPSFHTSPVRVKPHSVRRVGYHRVYAVIGDIPHYLKAIAQSQVNHLSPALKSLAPCITWLSPNAVVPVRSKASIQPNTPAGITS